VLGGAPCVLARQEPECRPGFTLDMPDECVAPGQDLQPVDLQALLDQQNPGHPDVTAWRVLSKAGPPPPHVTIDNGVATLSYPFESRSCREVEFLAWQRLCSSDLGQAKGRATFSVAPSRAILAIGPEESDPQASACDTVLLNLDLYVAGGVDPADITSSASGQSSLQVTIAPNTHVAELTNTCDSCNAVTDEITFRACLPDGANHDPGCVDGPDYCEPSCAEAMVTFTLICDADGDGVADQCDICPGHDDKLDGDGDGVPDGCDICAGYDDNADSDGDGIPDGCDEEDGPGPQPTPQPFPECPESIQAVAVGWFCRAAGTVRLALVGFGVFLTGDYGKRP